MKRRKIISVLLSILTIWLLLISTDFILPTIFNEKPFFSVWTNKIKDGGSGVYQGIGYSIEIRGDFLPEQKKKVYYTQIKILNLFTYTVN